MSRGETSLALLAEGATLSRATLGLFDLPGYLSFFEIFISAKRETLSHEMQSRWLTIVSLICITSP